jgi:hypothetical protein
MASKDTQATELKAKLKTWLSEEGYPIEFKAANICRSHDFRVWQGFHVRDEKTELPREIDVVASMDHPSRDILIRVEHVLECKWSRDKPWIAFSSSSTPMAPSACTAQTIGNLLGTAAIWAIAGDLDLHSLDHFSTPERPGFGGRQAFSKGQDHFYSALAAVSDLAVLLATRGEGATGPSYTMPNSAILAFPVVVVDGLLYEAHFDEETNDIQLTPRNRVRCHWRGASSWNLITTIDIVTLDHLDDFMRVRARDSEALLMRLQGIVGEISECFEKQSLRPLNISAGPRGVLGVPRLLRELHSLDRLQESKRSRRRRSQSRLSKR